MNIFNSSTFRAWNSFQNTLRHFSCFFFLFFQFTLNCAAAREYFFFCFVGVYSSFDSLRNWPIAIDSRNMNVCSCARESKTCFLLLFLPFILHAITTCNFFFFVCFFSVFDTYERYWGSLWTTWRFKFVKCQH